MSKGSWEDIFNKNLHLFITLILATNSFGMGKLTFDRTRGEQPNTRQDLGGEVYPDNLARPQMNEHIFKKARNILFTGFDNYSPGFFMSNNTQNKQA